MEELCIYIYGSSRTSIKWELLPMRCEQATNSRILFFNYFTNHCTNLGGYVITTSAYMITTSNAKDFILFPFLLLINQPSYATYQHNWSSYRVFLSWGCEYEEFCIWRNKACLRVWRMWIRKGTDIWTCRSFVVGLSLWIVVPSMMQQMGNCHSCIYRNGFPVANVEQPLQWMQPAGRGWPLLLWTPIIAYMTCIWTMHLKANLC